MNQTKREEFPNFWNRTHELSTKANDLFEKLVPAEGKADTIVGELLRASSRISYDWYNNGWGCNNWSGAVMYIMNEMDELRVPAEKIAELRKNLDAVYNYSHGEPTHFNRIDREDVDRIVTKIHEIIVEGILASSPVDWAPNEIDMFDYQEPSYFEDEDEDF